MAERQKSSASASSSGLEARCGCQHQSCMCVQRCDKPLPDTSCLACCSDVHQSETLSAKKRYRQEQREKQMRAPTSEHGPPPASFAALGELAAQQGREAAAEQQKGLPAAEQQPQQPPEEEGCAPLAASLWFSTSGAHGCVRVLPGLVRLPCLVQRLPWNTCIRRSTTYAVEWLQAQSLCRDDLQRC